MRTDAKEDARQEFMKNKTVYSKTAKGMAEVRKSGKSLPKDHSRVLAMVDGKSSTADLMGQQRDLTQERFTATVESLVQLGLIRALVHSAWDPEPTEPIEMTDDGTVLYSDALPTIEATELSPQESVQAWAEARRGAQTLKKNGFYTYGDKPSQVSAIRKMDGLRALVVEDDDALSQLLEVLLTNKGFSVHKAVDIPGAMKTLRAGLVPDLVLLDVVLPGMPGKDGFLVLDQIRHTAALRLVPVIMVTSKVTDESVMRGLKAGADGYIFKPFKWETLYESIKSVIGA
ncbi:MAG: two-component system, OmpR family, phosphate regulon response regulator PhoB [Burkholderiales bacterium]